LGELGGGEWDLVAQWWSMASPLSLIATGRRSGLAGEGEREGKVRCGFGLTAG
jgi:hypothetical protein